MPVQGDLKAMSVTELLMWISQFQKTGTLEIRTSEWTETMAFEQGSLVFSSSSNPDRTLGTGLGDRSRVFQGHSGNLKSSQRKGRRAA